MWLHRSSQDQADTRPRQGPSYTDRAYAAAGDPAIPECWQHARWGGHLPLWLPTTQITSSSNLSPVTEGVDSCSHLSEWWNAGRQQEAACECGICGTQDGYLQNISVSPPKRVPDTSQCGGMHSHKACFAVCVGWFVDCYTTSPCNI